MSYTNPHPHKARPFCIVAIDETRHWGDSELVRRAGRIWTLYAFDPGEVTYCCELTPSHYLIPFDLVPKNDLCEDDRDSVQCEVCHCEPIYMHCHSVPSGDMRETHDFDPDCTLNDAVEEFRCNGYCPKGVIQALKA